MILEKKGKKEEKDWLRKVKKTRRGREKMNVNEEEKVRVRK